MRIICDKRCVIGEGPIWNEKENLLYFVNAAENQILKLDVYTGELKIRTVLSPCYAVCFNKENRLIVSRKDGVFVLNDDDSVSQIYDTEKYQITNANDMKVGPDGNIYVGTICGKRLGVSDKIDGKLYRIESNGQVKILLDGLSVSNGMDWSVDGSKFYHTDSVTGYIKEYAFDKNGITYTGKKVFLPGVDGFTVDSKDRLVATRWDDKKVSIVDTKDMSVVEEIEVPFANPASCCFAGEDYKTLIIVTANYDTDICLNKNAGYTFLVKRKTGGKKPYLFG